MVDHCNARKTPSLPPEHQASGGDEAPSDRANTGKGDRNKFRHGDCGRAHEPWRHANGVELFSRRLSTSKTAGPGFPGFGSNGSATHAMAISALLERSATNRATQAAGGTTTARRRRQADEMSGTHFSPNPRQPYPLPGLWPSASGRKRGTPNKMLIDASHPEETRGCRSSR